MTHPLPSEPDLRMLSKRQHAVLNRLERALDAANKAGIAICGMDDSLYAYRADDFDRLAAELPSSYEVQQALADTSRTIEDHGAYRESGGW